MWPARTPPTRVQGGGRRPVPAGGGTSGARASRAGLGGMFRPSAPLVCMLAQRCGKKNRRASPQNDPARLTWVGVSARSRHVRRAGSAEACALGFPAGIRSYACVPSDLPRKSSGPALILRPRAMPRLGSISGEELVERDFCWERARARIFCWESTGGIDINRSTIKNRVANPKSRRAASTEGEV